MSVDPEDKALNPKFERLGYKEQGLRYYQWIEFKIYR